VYSVKKLLLAVPLALLGLLTLPAADEPNEVVRSGKQEFLAQTGAISTVTVFTPLADGDYRITIYYSGSLSSTISANVFVNYTDSFYGKNHTMTGQSPTADTTQSWVSHLKAGTSVTMQTTVGTGTLDYDVFVEVERL
jgi:hypothetical protein